jgi:hypothetical protein
MLDSDRFSEVHIETFETCYDAFGDSRPPLPLSVSIFSIQAPETRSGYLQTHRILCGFWTATGGRGGVCGRGGGVAGDWRTVRTAHSQSLRGVRAVTPALPAAGPQSNVARASDDEGRLLLWPYIRLFNHRCKATAPPASVLCACAAVLRVRLAFSAARFRETSAFPVKLPANAAVISERTRRVPPCATASRLTPSKTRARLAQIVGQAQGSGRVAQSKHWAKPRKSGQPCAAHPPLPRTCATGSCAPNAALERCGGDRWRVLAAEPIPAGAEVRRPRENRAQSYTRRARLRRGGEGGRRVRVVPRSGRLRGSSAYRRWEDSRLTRPLSVQPQCSPMQSGLDCILAGGGLGVRRSALLTLARRRARGAARWPTARRGRRCCSGTGQGSTGIDSKGVKGFLIPLEASCDPHRKRYTNFSWLITI